MASKTMSLILKNTIFHGHILTCFIILENLFYLNYLTCNPIQVVAIPLHVAMLYLRCGSKEANRQLWLCPDHLLV